MDNTFLREAIEKIEELTDSAREPHVVKIAGKTYCDKSMSRYDREEFAEPLTATSLNSLIDYISGKSEELRESMIIHVESPTRVRLLSGLTQERNREELFRVGTNPNGFDFDHYYDQEAFVINMQTAFKQSDETELILSVAGNVENKTVANYGDDGVSQKATITKGIAGKEDVIVPNPVTLRPYRTFLEVEQPESKFIFRIREGSDGQPMFKLVEADGGLWKYEAVDAIKKYLTVSLPEELPGAPKGKARARTVRSKKGGTFSYTSEGTMLYENLIKCCYRQESNNIVFNDGQPLKVTIIAYYPIVKSTSKKKKQQMLEDLMFPTKKPDIDNIAKSILDALNKLAYRDDTQVVTLHMEKHYAENPRVEVEIEEIK